MQSRDRTKLRKSSDHTTDRIQAMARLSPPAKAQPSSVYCLQSLLLQPRQALRLYKEANGSGLPMGSFDEAVALQGLDHVVDRGR